MFFRSDQKKMSPVGAEPIIRFISGGFYLHEKPENLSNSLYSLYPLDESGDLEFASLAKECAVYLLNQFPAVINQCQSIFAKEIQKEKFVQAYLNAGGKPIFTESRTMLTITEGMDRKLVACIPKDEFACYEFTFYGFHSMLSAKSREKDYIIKIDYHEEHDFLQIEMERMTDHIITQIQEICKKHGRVLTGYDQILR